MKAFLQAISNDLIGSLHLKEADRVLDLATGNGEPGLSIARLVNKGKVIGVDFSLAMLSIAQRKAAEQGITNFHTLYCEASKLPFADNSFDAICCRNGYMFFPDLLTATREVLRVLKKGGRIAVAVWGERQNNAWVSLPLEVLEAYRGIVGSTMEEISLFGCAKPYMLLELFRQAGFRKVTQQALRGKVRYESKEHYWQFITGVTAPVALAIAQVEEALQEEVKASLFERLAERSIEGKVVFDYESLIIRAEK